MNGAGVSVNGVCSIRIGRPSAKLSDAFCESSEERREAVEGHSKAVSGVSAESALEGACIEGADPICLPLSLEKSCYLANASRIQLGFAEDLFQLGFQAFEQLVNAQAQACRFAGECVAAQYPGQAGVLFGKAQQQ